MPCGSAAQHVAATMCGEGLAARHADKGGVYAEFYVTIRGILRHNDLGTCMLIMFGSKAAFIQLVAK